MTDKQTPPLHEESLTLLKDLSFCVFDLETTGGNQKSDKIIEIGMVRIENLEVVDQKEFLIQPEIKIPEFIQKLTSIRPADVEHSPLIEDVIDEILEFMGDTILVAHNTSFDVPFFNSVLRRLNRPELPNKSICTNLMTKYLIPNLLNSNLNYMSKIFNISHKKAHRALDDAKATAELLLNYLKIFINKDVRKINHLYYPRNRYELDRIHYKKGTDSEIILNKMDSLQTPSLITIKGENGVILYSLPSLNGEKEKEVLKTKLDSLDWETATIKLFGPLIEAFIQFNHLFTKLEPNVRTEVLKFLWKNHLPKMKMPNRSGTINPEDIPEVLGKDFGDFFISHHLVPEQMVIYPLTGLHQKNQLIFRFPSHKKKLLQYISSKSSRMSSNKLKKVHYHPMLREFIDNYLKAEKEKDKGSSLFIFQKHFPTKKPEAFLKELDSFLSKNPNPYNYPSEYI